MAAVLVVLTPLFWFPWMIPAVTLGALPLLPITWVATRNDRSAVATSPTVATILALLLAATCAATLSVVDWKAGLAKVLGMSMGVFALAAASTAARDPRTRAFVIPGLSLLTLFTIGIGFVAGDWRATSLKVPLIGPLMELIQFPLRASLLAGAGTAININELAGVLILVTPVLLSYAAGLTYTAAKVRVPHWLWATGLIATLVVILSQSRSALVAMCAYLVGLTGFAVYKRVRKPDLSTRARTVIIAAYAVPLIFGAIWFSSSLSRWMRPEHTLESTGSFEQRLEVWQRAVYMFRDFAYVGIGPGQFDRVLRLLYPSMLTPPTHFVAHSHNLVLEYAVELGALGATAFVTLIGSFFWHCWHAARSSVVSVRWLGVGAASGFTCFLVFGLTDAIAPGARAGLIQWLVLGIGFGAGARAREAHAHSTEETW